MAGNSIELYKYKQMAMSAILGSADICNAIKATDADGNPLEPSDLSYTHVFPHGYVPQTIEDVGCYITIEIGTPNVSMVNDVFKNVVMTITVICHQDMMRTDNGMTRIDYISTKLDDLFNRNYANKMGVSQMKLASNIEGYIDVVHRCRILKFTTNEMASSMCGNGIEVRI